MTFNKDDFELIIGGKDKAIQEIKQAEIKEEYSAVKYISISNKACCTTQKGRDASGSFGLMIGKWAKTWSDEDVIKHSWLIRVEDTIEKFREWIFEKYEDNKKQKEKWQEYFDDEDIFKDMIIVLKSKIFELKLDPANAGLCEFQDKRVYLAVIEKMNEREQRKRIHEGLNRIKKYAFEDEKIKNVVGVPEDEEFSDYQKLQLMNMIEEVIENKLLDRINENHMIANQNSSEKKKISTS